jgi:acetate kinase
MPALNCGSSSLKFGVYRAAVKDAEVRREIREPLQWMKPFETRVLPAQEDLQIARITLACSAAESK